MILACHSLFVFFSFSGFFYDVWTQYRSLLGCRVWTIGFLSAPGISPFSFYLDLDLGWLYRLYRRHYRPHTHTIYFTICYPIELCTQGFTPAIHTLIHFCFLSLSFIKPIMAKLLSISNVFQDKFDSLSRGYLSYRADKQTNKQNKDTSKV